MLIERKPANACFSYAKHSIPIFKAGEKPETGLSAVNQMERPLGFFKTLRVLFQADQNVSMA